MPCATTPQDPANELPVDFLVAALGYVGAVASLVYAVAPEAARKIVQSAKEHLDDDVSLLASALVAQGLVIAVNLPAVRMLVEEGLDDALLLRLGAGLPSW